ncbi:MAG: hypothetical protein M0023_00210 [Desulfobacteraceae bacterium]|nr:hypothetical protein [Desulfobacteraceae bacterium]
MNEITYKDIDLILLPWAETHKLYVMTRYKDEEVRSMTVVDSCCDQYGISAILDRINGKSTVVVGADLLERGAKKHTFHRERQQYHFRKPADLAHLEMTLSEALELTRVWGAESAEATSNRTSE